MQLRASKRLLAVRRHRVAISRDDSHFSTPVENPRKVPGPGLPIAHHRTPTARSRMPLACPRRRLSAHENAPRQSANKMDAIVIRRRSKRIPGNRMRAAQSVASMCACHRHAATCVETPAGSRRHRVANSRDNFHFSTGRESAKSPGIMPTDRPPSYPHPNVAACLWHAPTRTVGAQKLPDTPPAKRSRAESLVILHRIGRNSGSRMQAVQLLDFSDAAILDTFRICYLLLCNTLLLRFYLFLCLMLCRCGYLGLLLSAKLFFERLKN